MSKLETGDGTDVKTDESKAESVLSDLLCDRSPYLATYNWQHKIDELTEEERTELLLCLCLKREVDGLNGRIWDASEHYKWEMRIAKLLDT